MAILSILSTVAHMSIRAPKKPGCRIHMFIWPFEAPPTLCRSAKTQTQSEGSKLITLGLPFEWFKFWKELSTSVCTHYFSEDDCRMMTGPRNLGRLTKLFRDKTLRSPFQPSKFSFEHLLLPPKSAPEAVAPRLAPEAATQPRQFRTRILRLSSAGNRVFHRLPGPGRAGKKSMKTWSRGPPNYGTQMYAAASRKLPGLTRQRQRASTNDHDLYFIGRITDICLFVVSLPGQSAHISDCSRQRSSSCRASLTKCNVAVIRIRMIGRTCQRYFGQNLPIRSI